jgi:hypothetical protein
MSSVTASSAAGIYGATPATICEVFTLNESAYWRPAATAAPPPCHRPWRNIRQGGVFCNGNLHFLDDSGGITVFNVQDETFGTLGPPGPPSSSRRWGAVCAFTASFDGLVIVTVNAMPSTCGCSSLKEYSIAKWEKLCHIGCGDDAPRRASTSINAKLIILDRAA